jgi:NAD(P)-dependent dehydrogenase (short-subunit alcohol dehydrogenase family)
MKDVEGRVAVVTGGASGIGLATAHLLAEQGMRLVLADVEAVALARAAEAITSKGGDVLAVPCDVTSQAAVDDLASAAFDRFGHIHVLFNNAGVAATAATLRLRAWEGSLADWDWTLSVNLMGVVHGLRAFVPRMLDDGEEGHIVNTASMAGLLAGANPYNVSKHGVVCLTEGIHRDLREMGARISASVVCPGLINTSILDAERNRADTYGGKTDVDELRVEVRQFATEFAAALAAGYPPEVVADHVLEAIRNDRFYVFPAQPEILEQVDARMTGIVERRNPGLAATT